jgi:8-oxo-dGTP diphosphatase
MRSAYGAREREISEHPVTIIVDTANVMGARPDGWWRDRAAAAVRLYAELDKLAASGRPILPDEPDETAPPEFVMVLEGAAKAASSRLPGPAPSGPAASSTAPSGPAASSTASSDPASSGAAPSDTAPPGRIRVVQAPGSGDDAIVALVRELPGRRVVVTADRELRDRCQAAGATVLGPGWLLGLLRE